MLLPGSHLRVYAVPGLDPSPNPTPANSDDVLAAVSGPPIPPEEVRTPATPVDLGKELRKIQIVAEADARRHGLDFYPTIFEVVSADQLNAIAAYGGFPQRYRHYSFGAEFNQLKKGYDYGLQKIYELVINNDPCIAYLMSSNTMTDHKLVIAHVLGHCDFFKNNYCFAHTNRKMIDQMGDHKARVDRIIDRYGIDEVEKFIDVCKSVDDLIDIQAAGIRRDHRVDTESQRRDPTPPPPPARFGGKDYMCHPSYCCRSKY